MKAVKLMLVSFDSVLGCVVLLNLRKTRPNHLHPISEITNKLLAGQCFVFFFAGFETSSTTLGYCMLELAQNQQIQNKVREEITTILEKNDGKVTYEALKQMTYTDMVIAGRYR